MMLLFTLALAAQVQPPVTRPAQVEAPEIFVTAARLDAAFKECEAQRCSPLRDAQVSIARAEQFFRAGDYKAARKTLAGAMSRNKRKAAVDPRAVSAIYEAYATVTLHDGDMDAYRRGVAGQVRTVRDHLQPADPAAMSAAFALGDMWIERRDYRTADQTFRAGERQALADGLPRIAALLAIRRIMIADAVGNGVRADRLMADLMARPVAAEPAMRRALKVVAVRRAARGADDATMAAMAAEIGSASSTRPTLIWQPVDPLAGTADATAQARRFGEPDVPAAELVAAPAWADIGYWIRPDGRTAEIDVLRGSYVRKWTVPVVAQIRGRRYSTTAAAADDPGVYRIERVTLRRDFFVPKGSLVRQRAGPLRLETVDLTVPRATVTAQR